MSKSLSKINMHSQICPSSSISCYTTKILGILYNYPYYKINQVEHNVFDQSTMHLLNITNRLHVDNPHVMGRCVWPDISTCVDSIWYWVVTFSFQLLFAIVLYIFLLEKINLCYMDDLLCESFLIEYFVCKKSYWKWISCNE